MAKIKLEYIKGSGFIPGIPAKDLTAQDVKIYGGEKKLLATGLYKKPVLQNTKQKKEG